MPLSSNNGSIKLQLLRTLATVATISTAPYYTASAQSSPTLCSCSPRTFNFKLNFAGNCKSTSLTGVSEEVCFFTNRSDDDATEDAPLGGVLSTFRSNEKNDLWRRLLSTTSNQNQRGLQNNFIPTSVELVEIFEVDSSYELNVINQEEYNQNFSDGDEFQFTSISSKLDPNKPLSEQLEYFPNALILVLDGVNSDNERKRNIIAWKYNIEDCTMEQITPGDYIGWITVADDTPASGTFCPAAVTSSPTQSPTLSFSPTLKPTVSPTTLAPVVATNSPTPPTPSGWGSDGYGDGKPNPVEKPSSVTTTSKADKPSPSPVRTLDPALPEEILDWPVTKSPIYNTAPSYKPTNSPHSKPSMCEACPNGITVEPSTETEFGNTCGGISAAAAKWPADSKTCARIKAFESKCCPSGGEETSAAATTEAPKTTVAATTEAPMTTAAATIEAKPSGGDGSSGGGGHGFEDSEYKPSPLKPSQPSGEGWSSGVGGHKPSMCEACPNGVTVDPSTHTEYGNNCGGISAAAAKWPADSKTCARIKSFESKCCPSGEEETTAAATTEAPMTTTAATTEAKPSGGGSSSGGGGHGFEDSEYKPSKPSQSSGEGWSSGGGGHKPSMCEACPNGITVDPSTHTEFGHTCGGISAAAARWPADSKTCARIKAFESKCCPSGGQETTEAPVTTTTATTEAKPSGGVGHGFEDSEYKPSPSKPAKPSGEGWSSGGGHHKPNSTGSKSAKHMSISTKSAKHGKSESSMSHGLWASSSNDEHTKSAKHGTTIIVHTKSAKADSAAKSAKSEGTKTKSSKVNGLSWASQHTKSAKHSGSKTAKSAKSTKSEGTKSAKAKHFSTNMSHQVNDKWSAIKEHARYVYNNW